MSTARESPSLVILRNPTLKISSPLVRNRLKLTLMRRRKRMALSPLTIKRKGTLDTLTQAARNRVAAP